jgi:hypothetical protein
MMAAPQDDCEIRTIESLSEPLSHLVICNRVHSFLIQSLNHSMIQSLNSYTRRLERKVRAVTSILFSLAWGEEIANIKIRQSLAKEIRETGRESAARIRSATVDAA